MGSYDQASPVDRLRAVDLAMRHYWGTADWLAARRRARPGG